MRLAAGTFLIITVVLTFSNYGNAQEKTKDSDKIKSKPNPRVNSKYDKSKDLTTVRVKEFTITRLAQEKEIAANIPLHQMDMEASFTYSGQTLIKPAAEVSLRFHAVAGNYVFLRAQQVVVALNRESQTEGKALVLGMTDYTSGPPKFNSVYEEFMTIKIPAEVIAKIAKAKSVQFFVGPVGYSLNPEQQGYLVGLNELLWPKPLNAQTGQ